ncbi:MAG: hypothetical protein H6540_00605 [Bacteroidales bacterium]|nr:hypothetical protein [Bacteroidales bacterium]
MKPILIAGSSIVTLALIFYSIAFFRFHKRKVLDSRVLSFQSLGLLFDITATTLMIIGSSKGPFTLHGMLGYSSLTLMIIDTAFFWNNRRLVELPSWLRLYSKISYSWWVAAYITGSLLVMLR